MNEISRKLRNARIAAGYRTAKEFAEEKNLPVATYYQHESGVRNPKLATIEKYCKLLQLPVELLIKTQQPANIKTDQYYFPSRKPTVMSHHLLLHSAATANNKISINYKNMLSDKISNALLNKINKLDFEINHKDFTSICNILQETLIKHPDNGDNQTELINAVMTTIELVIKQRNK